MPRPKGSKNKVSKKATALIENIDEKIAALEEEVKQASEQLKSKKAELKKLMKAKKDQAEALLLGIAEQLPDPAAGLLLWDSASRFLRPLVYVRESGTLIWESGCGSGSTALGVCLAQRRGDGITLTEIRQPGGTLRTRVTVQEGQARSVLLSGVVRIGETALLTLP